MENGDDAFFCHFISNGIQCQLPEVGLMAPSEIRL